VSHDPTFWLLARASGLTAYVLLTLAVIAGITVKTRVLGQAARAASVVDVHRFLTTLTLGALAIHALTLVLDTTVRITPLALLVPGLSPYRPLPTGLGVLAAELMVLVVLSFRFRRRIGMRAWRALHFATYPIFLLATAHGLLAGTDSSAPWAFDLYAGAVGVVAAATTWRALTVVPRRRPKGATT
jgi:methionine sulfoxide reductase heme-binding subunit